jgi:hypothetical protein
MTPENTRHIINNKKPWLSLIFSFENKFNEAIRQAADASETLTAKTPEIPNPNIDEVASKEWLKKCVANPKP